MSSESIDSLERTARWVQMQAYSRRSSQTSTTSQPQQLPPQRSPFSPHGLHRENSARSGRAGTSYPHPVKASHVAQPSLTPTPSLRHPRGSIHTRYDTQNQVHPQMMDSQSRSQPRSQGRSGSYGHGHGTRPYIPTIVYPDERLPAFVQGPPGSGYPMTMSGGRPLPHMYNAKYGGAHISKPPSPPVHIPTPMNPKVSLPILLDMIGS